MLASTRMLCINEAVAGILVTETPQYVRKYRYLKIQPLDRFIKEVCGRIQTTKRP